MNKGKSLFENSDKETKRFEEYYKCIQLYMLRIWVAFSCTCWDWVVLWSTASLFDFVICCVADAEAKCWVEGLARVWRASQCSQGHEDSPWGNFHHWYSSMFISPFQFSILANTYWCLFYGCLTHTGGITLQGKLCTLTSDVTFVQKLDSRLLGPSFYDISSHVHLSD